MFEALLDLPLKLIAIAVFVGVLLILISVFNVPASLVGNMVNQMSNETGLDPFFLPHVSYWGVVFSNLLYILPVLLILIVLMFKKRD